LADYLAKVIWTFLTKDLKYQYMKRRAKLLLIISFLLFSLRIVSAQSNTVDLYFFYGQGCPHCAQAEVFLEKLKNQYPQLNIFANEVYYNQNNRLLYSAMAQAYGLNLAEIPVPVIYIDEKSFVGYSDYIGSQIRNEILRCLNQKCPSPIEKIQSGQNNQIANNKISFNNKISLKQSLVGWIVIGLIILIGIFLLVKLFSKKKKI